MGFMVDINCHCCNLKYCLECRRLRVPEFEGEETCDWHDKGCWDRYHNGERDKDFLSHEEYRKQVDAK